MPHANEPTRATGAASVSQPTIATAVHPQSLRDRIGQENMTQSSVLASRRLDEALLRLDRAAGRSRGSEPAAPTNTSPTEAVAVANRIALSSERDLYEEDLPPRYRAQRSGLELDQSVTQNSSMWLENEETSQQIRIDAGHADATSAPSWKPRLRPEPISEAPGGDPEPIETPHSTPESARAAVEHARISASDLEAMFTQSIDVMILSTTARIVDEEGTHPETAPEQAAAPASTRVPAQTAAPKEADSPVAEKTVVTAKVEESVETQPQAEPAPEPAPQLDAFTAAWQVDEFVVPATIDELFLSGSIAEQLASRLANARSQGLRTIAITSAKSGEGRSTVAVGLALSVAFSGLRVALVDADRTGVKIATDLHLDLDHSWPDAVRGNTPLEEIAVASEADALTLLPLLERNGEAPFQSEELRQTLARLQKSFDLVVVDCGAASISDVVLCDTALIVRDMQRTKAPEVETLALSLRRKGMHGVGVIENFC
ncbi:tyrosine-protein kinase family protein [Aporhodopirellula aestuarii]|uniref:P-loop NTPase n=1 Tax=Aporhodopirellula aestuarii TaxID=2950107 RepID=A0ABT0U683_9BACT|nr:P-loop NTPase [Aporhodopirellula aestuarii]MCM2372454.1 P-loop NTPase [Aporhodopirellula aestuarii]